MKALPLALLGAGLLAGCNSSSTTDQNTRVPEPDASGMPAGLRPGLWRGELAVQGQKIPFLFNVSGADDGHPLVVELINRGLNGEERLRCDDIKAAGDSAVIHLHVFDAALVVRADGENKLKGTWVKYDAKTPYRVPLVAEVVTPSPQTNDKHVLTLPALTYSAEFKDETGATYPAVGVFKFDQKSSNLVGSFLTTTGDYRYLSNDVGAKALSTFDGSHAFLFTINSPIGDDLPAEIKGDFYAGKSGHETWTATLDPKAKLPDADTLTYLKKGESRLSFKFPSVVEGGSISPTDAKYRGKVVVLQVLGSWCPNCMDETGFLAPWYEKNKARGVEVIGLGYERSSEYNKAAPRLRKLKERFDIGYDLAVAGVANKDSVAKSLPQLAKFMAFPTTIFLDKKGAVRSIHTGFSGPGTGKYYEEEMANFNRTVDKLLKE